MCDRENLPLVVPLVVGVGLGCVFALMLFVVLAGGFIWRSCGVVGSNKVVAFPVLPKSSKPFYMRFVHNLSQYVTERTVPLVVLTVSLVATKLLLFRFCQNHQNRFVSGLYTTYHNM